MFKNITAKFVFLVITIEVEHWSLLPGVERERVCVVGERAEMCEYCATQRTLYILMQSS